MEGKESGFCEKKKNADPSGAICRLNQQTVSFVIVHLLHFIERLAAWSISLSMKGRIVSAPSLFYP